MFTHQMRILVGQSEYGLVERLVIDSSRVQASHSIYQSEGLDLIWNKLSAISKLDFFDQQVGH